MLCAGRSPSCHEGDRPGVRPRCAGLCAAMAFRRVAPRGPAPSVSVPSPPASLRRAPQAGPIGPPALCVPRRAPVGLGGACALRSPFTSALTCRLDLVIQPACKAARTSAADAVRRVRAAWCALPPALPVVQDSSCAPTLRFVPARSPPSPRLRNPTPLPLARCHVPAPAAQ